MASVAQSLRMGTYDVPAEDVAAAILEGPWAAYLRRFRLFDPLRSAETAETDND